MTSSAQDLQRLNQLRQKRDVNPTPKNQRNYTNHRNTVVTQNMGLVHHVARKYTKNPELLQDLIQAGTIGLIQALDRFDPTKGKLSPYCIPWITGKVCAELSISESSGDLSLDASINTLDGEGIITRHERIPAPTITAPSRDAFERWQEQLNHILSLIPEHRAKLVRLRYGV